MSEGNFYEEFESYYSNIPDCIGHSVDNYEDILHGIFELTNQLLVMDEFNGIQKEDEFQLDLTINGKEYVYEFSGGEYFHQDLLIEFNKIIEKELSGDNRRFFEIGDGVNFDFAIVFAPREMEYQLAKAGIIWRSEDWLANFVPLALSQESDNYSGDSAELPEYWLGTFSEDSPFKLMIKTRDKNGNFEGVIYEGADFETMQNSHITCHGNITHESIKFKKYYDLSVSTKKIQEITGKEIRSSVDKNQVNYSGVKNGHECKGKFETVPYTLFFEGKEREYASLQGVWEMKRVSYDSFKNSESI